MDALVLLIPFLPLMAFTFTIIGLPFCKAKSWKSINADIIGWALSLSSLMAWALLISDVIGKNHGYFSLGQWINSDTLAIRVNFTTTGFGVWVTALMSLLVTISSRISVSRIENQSDVYRTYSIIALLTAGYSIIALSANLVNSLCAWIIAQWCVYILIAIDKQASEVAENATKYLICQCLGDVGFVLGISLCYAWTDSVNWAQLQASARELSVGQATGISLCFALAAFAKSGQLPFTPWLAKTLSQSIPSSQILPHLGVFMIITLEAVFMQSPFARAVIGLFGFATVIYCFVDGKTQTDNKKSSTLQLLGQIGLMYIECALGLWYLASWHLCINMTVAGLQSIRHKDIKENRPSVVPIRLYLLSIQNFWVTQIIDWALVNPVRGLAQDLSYVDDRIIDRLIGLPSTAEFSHLTKHKGKEASALLSSITLSKSSSFIGRITEWLSTVLHWFEGRLILRHTGKNTSKYMRQTSHAVNQFEQIILRPRYLVLFVCITFLVAF